MILERSMKRWIKWTLIILIVLVALFFIIGYSIKAYRLHKKYAIECRDLIFEDFPGDYRPQRDNYDECVINLAIEKNDIKICEKTYFGVGPFLDCYLPIIIKNKDPKLCEELNRMDKLLCLGVVNSDEEYCDQEETYEEYCEKSQDMIKCMGTIRNICLNGISLAKSDVDLCLEAEPYYCLNQIALQKEDSEICNRWEEYRNGSESSIAGCKKSVAIKTENEKLCYEINSSYLQDKCLQEIAIKTENEKLCLELTSLGSTSEVECITTIAFKTKNEKICTTSYCFSELARIKNDEEICKEMLIEEGMEERMAFCITSVAISKEDVGICEKIINTENKEYCENRVKNCKPTGTGYNRCKNF
jgi:hypothetical protein